MSASVAVTVKCDVCGKTVEVQANVDNLYGAGVGKETGWERVTGQRDIDVCPACLGTPYSKLLGIQKDLLSLECKEVELLPAPAVNCTG